MASPNTAVASAGLVAASLAPSAASCAKRSRSSSPPLQLEPIPRAVAREDAVRLTPPAARLEDLAELEHVALERVPRRRRRALAPDLVDQDVARHRCSRAAAARSRAPPAASARPAAARAPRAPLRRVRGGGTPCGAPTLIRFVPLSKSPRESPPSDRTGRSARRRSHHDKVHPPAGPHDRSGRRSAVAGSPQREGRAFAALNLADRLTCMRIRLRRGFPGLGELRDLGGHTGIPTTRIHSGSTFAPPSSVRRGAWV